MTTEIIVGDCLDVLRTMPDESIQCCVTSPPYFGLRDYGVEGQLGLEPTPSAYVAKMVEVFAEVRRVLRDDGTLWLNIGDSYAGSFGAQSRDKPGAAQLSAKQGGSRPAAVWGTGRPPTAKVDGCKPKDLIGIPWMLAFALRADGWYLRAENIWAKPNPMPESVTDRTTRAHEQIFTLTKAPRYYYDAEAIKTPPKYATEKRPDGWSSEPGAHGSFHKNGREKGARIDKQSGHGRRHAGFNDRWDATEGAEQQARPANLRSVWTIPTQGFKEAHFATMPPKLVEPCILAGCPKGGVVLDPFSGAGTVGLVASRLGRDYIGIELNPEYAEMSRRRIHNDAPLFAP